MWKVCFDFLYTHFRLQYKYNGIIDGLKQTQRSIIALPGYHNTIQKREPNMCLFCWASVSTQSCPFHVLIGSLLINLVQIIAKHLVQSTAATLYMGYLQIGFKSR
jgi:hypothetical protein